MMLNGDTTPYPSLFRNATGFTNYFNYLYPAPSPSQDYFSKYLNLELTRRAIHVGDRVFGNGSAVEQHLLSDIPQSVKPWVEELLDADYKVLFYNGQLDIIVAYPLTENFLSTLEWNHTDEYRNASRNIWKVDGEIAGYAVNCRNMTQLVVRNAGHMVPHDQPKWAYDMIHRFILNKDF